MMRTLWLACAVGLCGVFASSAPVVARAHTGKPIRNDRVHRLESHASGVGGDTGDLVMRIDEEGAEVFDGELLGRGPRWDDMMFTRKFAGAPWERTGGPAGWVALFWLDPANDFGNHDPRAGYDLRRLAQPLPDGGYQVDVLFDAWNDAEEDLQLDVGIGLMNWFWSSGDERMPVGGSAGADGPAAPARSPMRYPDSLHRRVRLGRLKLLLAGDTPRVRPSPEQDVGEVLDDGWQRFRMPLVVDNRDQLRQVIGLLSIIVPSQPTRRFSFRVRRISYLAPGVPASDVLATASSPARLASDPSLQLPMKSTTTTVETTTIDEKHARQRWTWGSISAAALLLLVLWVSDRRYDLRRPLM